jgi:hypothetical protein
MTRSSPPAAEAFDARGHAKRLLRTARTAALATLERDSGAPLTTLVSVGSDHDGAPLLLLSTLSAHTRNLLADERASLLLTGPSGRGDPLNRPRLTVGGPVAPHDAPSARARFLVRNPKSKLYASFGDFSVFRMEVQAVHFNGGFGRAAPMTPPEILTDLQGAEALLAMEAGLLAALNARDDGSLASLVAAEGLERGRIWRAIGLDPDGLDLAAGARAARIGFEAPARDPDAWRAALEARLRGLRANG